MERLYSATAIKKITKYTLIYEDDCFIEQDISLFKCRDNWYKHYNRKESLIDKILQKRKKCKYVGDRFLGYDEAYFLFYADTTVRFMFDINKYMELDDACEIRQRFGDIKKELNNAGWITFDIG